MKKDIREINLLWLWGDISYFNSFRSQDDYDNDLDSISQSLGEVGKAKSFNWLGHQYHRDLLTTFKEQRIYTGHITVNVPFTNAFIEENPFAKLVLLDPRISPLFPEDVESCYVVPKLQNGQQIKVVRGNFPLNQVRSQPFGQLEDAIIEDVPLGAKSEDYFRGRGFDDQNEFQRDYGIVRFG